MSLKHKVTINVAKPNGIRDPVIKSGSKSIRVTPNWLLGEGRCIRDYARRLG